MPTPLPIGAYPTVPFPAPHELMFFLLVAGFYLHLIPMNLALFGGVTSAGYLIKGKTQNDTYATRLGGTLAKGLPVWTSLAITNGLVPLLFLQVLYGPLILSSSIAMGAYWFSILFLLLIGYYAIYAFVYKKQQLGDKAPWLLILSSLLFTGIAYLFTNNMTLMLTPSKILPLVQQSATGMNLNGSEPTLWPRLLHFLLGAVAVNGLLIGSFGLYQEKRDPEYSGWLIRQGAGLFLAITLVQTIVGPWFLLSLPQEIWQQFIFNPAPAHKWAQKAFMWGMTFDLIALVAMSVAALRQSAMAFKVGLYSSLALIAAMVYMRHELRLMMLELTAPGFSPWNHPAEPQWVLLGIFGFLTVVFAIFLTWLGKQVWKSFHPAG
jgi:hypothetical protein